jgi:hypothetical protein
MIAVTKLVVTHLTGPFRRGEGERVSEGRLMATHPFGPGSTASSNPYSGSPAWNHSYGVAALRAGLIALALLAILAVIVLL